MRHLEIRAPYQQSLACLLALAGSFSVACAVDSAPDQSPGFPAGGSSGSGGGGRTYMGPGGTSTGGLPSTVTAGSVGATAGGAGAGGGAGNGGAAAGSGGQTTTAGAAAGGTGGTETKPLPSVCDNATRKLTSSKADALIDDFQGSALSVKWSRFSDVMPVPNSVDLLQVDNDGGATTMKSGHYEGTGAKTLAEGGFGVGIVFNLAIIKAQGLSCADISEFDGVSFWAKSGISNASVEVAFVVPETNAVKDGGDCMSGCYNHPRTSVLLSSDWKQYAVKFGDVFNGSAPIRDRVQQIAFLVPDAADWDFSVDEIAWFKGTPPTGPVAP